MRRVEFTDKTVKGFELLTTTVQERIFKKIRWLDDNFDEIQHQALSANLSGLFKLRIGDFKDATPALVFSQQHSLD